jgi:hypothetical protein
VHSVAEEDAVGLILFPGDGDVTSADVPWSYSAFDVFRQWLAKAEGFDLTEMSGFGGQRPWTDVSTTLQPLLNHRDDGGPDLTSAQCAAILPRVEEIVRHGKEEVDDPTLQRHFDDARRLVVVLQICVEKDVDLLFG